MTSETDKPTSLPDFVALGLGGTSMMALLWTVAMGHRGAGVEMRGDPFLGVHWNIREDFYHQLGLIDQMMLDRYGEERIPRRGDGRIFRLAECFYSRDTVAGDIVADEIIDGFDTEQHIVGTIQDIEFIDDRWRDGLPNRIITLVDPPVPPECTDPRKIRTSMVDVLDGPSMFQAEAASIQKLLRRYLERIEQQDLDHGYEPRVRLYTHHRVVPTDGDGLIAQPDGRIRIRIEGIREYDYKGDFVRVREPGSEVDLGVPELFIVAEGAHGSDARRLGFHQEDVVVDHGDGQGPVVAQADFLAGFIEVLVGGRLRRRVSSEFDQDGKEYWVRQIAVGHENDPEVGWVVVQVPDFKVFDPIAAGLVPDGTDHNSPEFFGAYKQMLYEFFIEQCSDVLEIPKDELMKVQMLYGPTLFSLIERVGADALIAANGVVAGDCFGNGHFLTSGGAMTGMVGHSSRVLEYWQSREAGTSPTEALRHLADQIREDTAAWLHVSAREYSEAVPINFGTERIEHISRAGGFSADARANAIDAARRQRHALVPLDPSNWRRLVVRNGKVLSALPELASNPPRLRDLPAATHRGLKKSPPLLPGTQRARRRMDQGLSEGDLTLLRPRRILETSATANQSAQGSTPSARASSEFKADSEDANRTVLMPWPPSFAVTQRADEPPTQILHSAATPLGPGQSLSVSALSPEPAKVYLCLDIPMDGQGAHRLVIPEVPAIIGRSDSRRGINPDVDLTPFDLTNSVSRQHALITFDNNAFLVEDLESRNRTRLGGAPLPPHQPQMLYEGAEVSFGSVRATVHLLGRSTLPTPWPVTGHAGTTAGMVGSSIMPSSSTATSSTL